MKLTFTNAFSKKNNPDTTEIDIQGKCQITNYDPREKNPDGKGDLTVNVDDEETSSVKNGTVLQEDNKTVNLNAKKFSIFTELAKLDGDGSTLTQDDIESAYKSYKNKDGNWSTLVELGVTAIRYDSHAGVATFVIGEKEILRIDFQTWRERIGFVSDSSKITTEETQEEPSINPLKDSQPKESVKENPTTSTNTFVEPKTYDSFFDSIAQAESSGNPKKMSVRGYAGLYQIGEQALADIGVYPKKKKYYNNWKLAFLPNKYGVKSLEDFKNNPDKQKLIFIDIMKKNWQYIHNKGLDRYIGETINGHLITESGLIAGAHLVGVNDLEEFIKSNGEKDPIDGNEKKVSEYIDQFAGHDMSSITGVPFGTKAHEIVYENIEYIVVSGDNLYSIAQRHNTTVAKIKEASNLNSNNLKPGQKLIVPQGKPVV